MLSDEKIIRMILGFKVRHLRQKQNLSYQELSEKTGLSTSYLNDIEKGKRYPKPDKITALAQSLGTDYNYMVSTNASKKLQPIIDLISSKFFRLFPLETFGINLEKLLELFTQTPDKVTAFISTIFKIGRNYQVGEKEFYLEALRSFQDMHNNHFPDLEEAVRQFKATYSIQSVKRFTPDFLEEQLVELYGIRIDRLHLSSITALGSVRSYFHKDQRILFLRDGLSEPQENFLLAREIGFQYLELKERPYETTIIKIDSFEKLLNNYKASHFASALLMDSLQLAHEVTMLARENTWQPERFLQLLELFNVTAETLMQRLTNILPHHFGLENLFFIRLTGSEDLKKFTMNKDLHLSQLHSPYNNELHEHYCNRWVSVTTIKSLRLARSKQSDKKIIADAQISRYWNTNKEYLCISLAKPSFRNPDQGVSVTLGLLVTPKLKSIFHFLIDPNLKFREVHTTCERCGIVDCEARVNSPIIIEQQERQRAILSALEEL